MNDEEYRKLANDTYTKVNGAAASRLLFSERLLAEEIMLRGDKENQRKMRNAYARLAIIAAQGLQLFGEQNEVV